MKTRYRIGAVAERLETVTIQGTLDSLPPRSCPTTKEVQGSLVQLGYRSKGGEWFKEE